MEGHGVGGGVLQRSLSLAHSSSSPIFPPSQYSQVSSPVRGASPEEDEKEGSHSWRQGPPPSPESLGLQAAQVLKQTEALEMAWSKPLGPRSLRNSQDPRQALTLPDPEQTLPTESTVHSSAMDVPGSEFSGQLGAWKELVILQFRAPWMLCCLWVGPRPRGQSWASAHPACP